MLHDGDISSTSINPPIYPSVRPSVRSSVHQSVQVAQSQPSSIYGLCAPYISYIPILTYLISFFHLSDDQAAWKYIVLLYCFNVPDARHGVQVWHLRNLLQMRLRAKIGIISPAKNCLVDQGKPMVGPSPSFWTPKSTPSFWTPKSTPSFWTPKSICHQSYLATDTTYTRVLFGSRVCWLVGQWPDVNWSLRLVCEHRPLRHILYMTQ